MHVLRFSEFKIFVHDHENEDIRLEYIFYC